MLVSEHSMISVSVGMLLIRWCWTSTGVRVAFQPTLKILW